MAVERLYRYERGNVGIGGGRSKAIVIYSVKRVLEEQGFSFDDALDNKSVYSPEVLSERLDAYSKESKVTVNDTAWKEAYDATYRAFGRSASERLDILSDDEVVRAVKIEKSAGLPTLAKKGDVLDKELARAKRINSDACAPPPCIAYHRVQHGDQGPKLRLVWGYPLSMTLNEARFARPLIQKFLLRQTPMAIGYRKMDLWARMSDIVRNECAVNLDYSGFDATVDPKLISMAFSILSSWFSREDREAYRWDKLVWYFIRTTILMPDGYVYRKGQGIPSGSYFTQLIGSVVNYFAIKYALARLKLEGNVIVLGDDSLFGISALPSKGSPWYSHVKHPGSDAMWLKGCFAAALRDLGLTINESKSMVFLGRSRESVSFLGHKWSKGYPRRSEKELSIRLVYPERFNPEYGNLREERALQFLGDAVEAWPLVRPILIPSRQGVCSAILFRLETTPLDEVGWAFHLAQADVRVTGHALSFRGLLT